jgi:rhodanese-related sulfurtransferase
MRLTLWFSAMVQSLGIARWLKALLTATFAMATLLPATSSAQGAAVSLEQARAEHEAGRALLVDIREPDEHATGVTAGAKLLPMRQLSSRLAELPRDRPVLLICNTQNRSRATYEALRERGYTNLRYVNGGMSEWVRRGWPVAKPGR